MPAFVPGAEFVIPSSTANIQYRPQMVMLENGNYLVSWADGSGRDPDGNVLSSSGGFTRFAQIFDRNGARVGDDFMLHPDGVTVAPLADYPVVATADGGLAVFRTSGTSVLIQTYSNLGVEGTSTTATPLTSVPGGAEIVSIIAGETPGEVIVVSRVETSDIFTGQQGDRYYTQVMDQTGAITGATVDIGFTTDSSEPLVQIVDGVLYAMFTVANQVGRYKITSFDPDSGQQIFTATHYFGATADVFRMSFGQSTGDGILRIAAAHWVPDPLDWQQATDEGMTVFSLDAQTLVWTETDAVITSATPGGWSVDGVELIELPFGQFFAVYTDWEDFRGQVLNADMSLVGAPIDLSVQNGIYQIASSGIHLGGGRVAISWDYSSGVGYQDPVTRFFDLTYEGDDLLAGTDEADSINAQDGNDTVTGGAGSDRILGGRGADDIQGGAQRDVIFGQKHGDLIHGDDGQDQLYGGSGRDTIYGGSGRDVLGGNRGRDVLVGGEDADVFVYNFNADEGQDAIQDFEDGLDLIKFRGGSFADLTVTQSGNHVDVTWANGTILIKNTDLASIDAADFFFV